MKRSQRKTFDSDDAPPVVNRRTIEAKPPQDEVKSRDPGRQHHRSALPI